MTFTVINVVLWIYAFEKFTFSICLEIWSSMNGHINETAPPLVPIGEVKLVQVQIVVWFVRTCEVWILFVFSFSSFPKS